MLITLGCSLLSLNSAELSDLESCLQSLSTWFSLNGLILNPSKSESALFSARQRSHSYVDVKSVSVAESVIPLADDVKILGVILDKNLSMDKHVGAVRKASYTITSVRYETSVDR
jgi:hypothetical protein